MARSFNGSTDYWQSSPPVTGAPFVIAGWFRTPDTANSQTIASIHASSGSGGTHRFSVVAGGGAAGDPLQFVANNNATQATAATSIGYQANVWHHFLAIARAANDREIRLDNGGAGTDTTSKSAASVNRYNIGARRQTSNTQFFSGVIAAVAVWNVAGLTEDDYATLAGGVHPFRVRPQSIVSFVDLVTEYDDLGAVGVFGGTSLAEEPPQLTLLDDESEWLYVPLAGGGSTLFRRTLFTRAGARGAV